MVQQNFNEDLFRAQVDKALQIVRTILENSKNPTYAADVHHKYDDKYLLADTLTNVTISALLNVLEMWGFTGKSTIYPDPQLCRL